MSKEKPYDEDFKKMIVNLYKNHTVTPTQIKREYGLSSSVIYN